MLITTQGRHQGLLCWSILCPSLDLYYVQLFPFTSFSSLGLFQSSSIAGLCPSHCCYHLDRGRVYFTHVSYPLSPSLTYFWYLGKMGDVSSSSDKVFGQKMHGILQRQRIDILLETVCHLQEVRYLNLFE